VSILVTGILAGGEGGGSGGGVPEAPADGRTYGRRNAGWTPVESSTYIHNQSSPSSNWSVQHNLGTKFLLINIFLSTGECVIGEPDWISATVNQISIAFSSALAGRAIVKPL
jgi:hypothetical protein